MKELDKKLEGALKQAVKNTLMDMSKHILGDKRGGSSTPEIVPIFKVYTVLDENWNIIHRPTHEVLHSSIYSFLKKITHSTRVVPRIEKVFRDKRSKKIAEIKAEIDEVERSGANTARASAMIVGVNCGRITGGRLLTTTTP